jgi:hypothetical protein
MIERTPISRRQLSRRWLFRAAGAAAAYPLLTRRSARAAAPEKIVLGSGRHRYEWVSSWAKLPEGMSFGNTHGCIVIDGKQRVLMNTDTENAIIAFDQKGKYLKSWGTDWKGGLHGMAIAQDAGKEVLWVAHTSRHEVVKSTLDGQVLMALPFPEQAGVYKDHNQYKPTSVAVAPNGNIYIGDGYGLSWVHQYTPKGEYVRSWGGKGAEPGKMNTPHGVWVDTRKKTPVLMVCDRGNHRLQIFDLDGKLLDGVTGILDLPCHATQHGQDIVVADLKGRVSILDKDNKLLVHLGENSDPAKRGQNKVPNEQWKDGEFTAPHCARWDAQGNLYVLDWNFQGRITKLKRVA